MTGCAGLLRRTVDADRPDRATLVEAANVIRRGGLVAFPTETFYGLGAHAFDSRALDRVFLAKGRPADKPLLVLVDSVAMAESLVVDVSVRARGLMARHWPGPLTLVLTARAAVPPTLTAGTGTIGVRLSSHPVATGLVRAAGVPITAPSANRHGAAPPRTAAGVAAGLGAYLDLLLDGGPSPGGPPSTVLDLTGPRPVVRRAGAVTLDAGDLL